MLKKASVNQVKLLRFGIVTSSVISLGFFPNYALGQITLDGTTNTTVTPIDNGVQIDQGDRSGGNLFHSFGEFSIPRGSEAFFNNPSDIVNIFSRVTGGNISNIDGLIRANGGANLFLINPAGILFGSDASLQIGGSFYGSTAHSILFPDGVEFAATSQARPILTINAPIGLRFRDNPGDIASTGDLVNIFAFTNIPLNPDKTIALLGGNLDLDKVLLSTAGGRIELGGLTAAGDLTITEDGSFSFPEGVPRGDISLSNFSSANVTGAAGTINLNGKNINLTSGSNLVAGIDSNLGNAQAGDINLNATGAISLNQVSSIQNQVTVNAVGNSGNINVTANSLNLTEGSFLSTSTFGLGDPGDVRISTTGDVSVSNSLIFSSVQTNQIETSQGGTIAINADTLALTDGSRFDVSAFGGGNIAINVTNLELINSLLNAGINPASQLVEAQAGDITINATEKIIITENNGFLAGISNSAGQFSTVGQIGVVTTSGSAGNITLNTKVLEGSGFFRISSISNGTGNTGKLTINATEYIALTGRNLGVVETNPPATEVTSILGPLGKGEGADITITTPSLSLSDTVIFTSTTGDGNAGNIILNIGNNLTLTDSSQIQAASLGDGNAGDIVINAENADISLQGENTLISASVISARPLLNDFAEDLGFSPEFIEQLLALTGIPSTSTGQGGDIVIQANNLSLTDQAFLLTSTTGEATSEELANSGSIFLNLAGNLTLINNSGFLSDTVGQGNGGQIIVNAGGDVVLDREAIISSTVSSLPELLQDFEQLRQGGDIQITARNLSLNNRGKLETNTKARGNAGTVTLKIRDTVAIEGMASLIASGVDETGEGNGGNIAIEANQVELTNGGSLSSATSGRGNAGNINISATEAVFVSGVGDTVAVEGMTSLIGSAVDAIGEGNGGNITIEANQVELTNGGILSSATFGKGNAGNINISATEAVSVSGVGSNVSTSVDLDAIGQGGEIEITAKNLRLNQGGQLRADSFGTGGAGNVTLHIGDIVAIDGVGGEVESGIVTIINPGAIGKGGDIEITANNLTLNNGGQLRADTFGIGEAGNVTLNITDQVLIDGFSDRILANNDTFSSSGITTAANTSQGTVAEGKAGNININTSRLKLSNGGVLSSGTDARGDGGTIEIDATESIEITGIDRDDLDGGIFSTSEANAVGNAGGINLTTSNLRISDFGEIAVNSNGQGNGGTLSVVADDLNLDNGSITAATQSGTGGEIKLQVDNNLTLENDSRISAQAFNQADGGNVEIQAEFVIGFAPKIEGNDIVASAEDGDGGKITITTEQVFGFEQGKATPGNRSNDLDVSSVLGIQGILAINTTNVDVSKGIVELAKSTVEAEETVTQACSIRENITTASGFTIKGRGGVPDVPTLPIAADYLLNEEEFTIAPNPNLSFTDKMELESFMVATAVGDILPARGIVIQEDGNIILTPYPVSHLKFRTPYLINHCPTKD